MFIKLTSALAVLAAASSAFAVVLPTSTSGGRSINPPRDQINPIAGDAAVPQLSARGMTNAKRLAAGLTPLPPKRRVPSRRQDAPAATPSGGTTTQGNLQLVDASTGSVIGYVGKDWNIFGEFESTTDVSAALVVSIDLVVAAAGQTDIATINGPDVSYPWFGAISGFASIGNNLAVGNYNYAYLGSTTQTSPGSPPTAGPNSFWDSTGIVEPFESAIFAYDATTSVITAQYINPDSSKPATYFALSGKVLVLIGDKGAFDAEFGASTPLKVKFVPI